MKGTTRVLVKCDTGKPSDAIKSKAVTLITKNLVIYISMCLGLLPFTNYRPLSFLMPPYRKWISYFVDIVRFCCFLRCIFPIWLTIWQWTFNNLPLNFKFCTMIRLKAVIILWNVVHFWNDSVGTFTGDSSLLVIASLLQDDFSNFHPKSFFCIFLYEDR